MKNSIFKISYVLLQLLLPVLATAQQSPVLSLSIPYQNNLLYNRYLINPTFSFVGENSRHISLYNRTQWISIDDSPKVYQLNYSGRFSDRTGYGIGLYQQNLGIITSFGGVGNAAYNVPFSEDMGLSLGGNIVFYSSGIDMSRVDVENPDPYLMSLDRRSLFSFHPGINFGYKHFDIGAYAENLINYDFKTNESVNEFAETTISGHLMYSYLFPENGTMLRAMFRVRNNETLGFNNGISFWANFPKFGWVQSGYDSYYGLALGGGLHLSQKLSAGLVYEKATRMGMQSFGGTYEFNLVFTLDSNNNSGTGGGANIGDDPNSSVVNNKRGGTAKNRGGNNNITTKGDSLAKIDPDKRYQSSMVKYSMNSIPDDEAYVDDDGSEAEEDYLTVKDTTELNKVAIQNQTKSSDTIKDDGEIKDKNTAAGKNAPKRETPPRMSTIDVVNIHAGYYVISGVFSKVANAENMIQSINKQGVKAYSFVNGRNNLTYVYLRYYTTLKDALAAYYSNVDNTYFGEIWILQVNEK